VVLVYAANEKGIKMEKHQESEHSTTSTSNKMEPDKQWKEK
jgi:hypothetical protein